MTTTPYLVSWNITKRCNLRCAHCYLDSDELRGSDDISTAGAKGIMDQIASLASGAMVVLTGGEPLLRDDIFELAAYASKNGLAVVLGTNGTLLDDAIAAAIRESGIKGVGVSLDSTRPAVHDSLRGVKGAWQATVEGMERLRRAGVAFQIQFTVTRENKDEVEDVAVFSEGIGASGVNFFFLVCTGRGQDVTDLDAKEYEGVLQRIVALADVYGTRLMVRARCAPHILRVAKERSPESVLLRGATSGCIAARGYLRIDPQGLVTPCPYIPPGAVGASSLGEKDLGDIWRNDPVFRAMRDPSYKGRCGECEYDALCGGCRARALAEKGDIMAEDPWCTYEPRGGQKGPSVSARPVWTAEAEERLKRVPVFVREMVRRGVEHYAASKGIREITPELLLQLRQRRVR